MNSETYEFEFDVQDWLTLDGYMILESDIWSGGMKWRVHLNDADPFPSSPHAHCIAGQKRHVGCKLHLGTAVLYYGKKPWKRVSEDTFAELIKKYSLNFLTYDYLCQKSDQRLWNQVKPPGPARACSYAAGAIALHAALAPSRSLTWSRQ